MVSHNDIQCESVPGHTRQTLQGGRRDVLIGGEKRWKIVVFLEFGGRGRVPS